MKLYRCRLFAARVFNTQQLPEYLAKADTYAHRRFAFAAFVTGYQVYPPEAYHFDTDILEAYEYFRIVVVFIDVQGIGTTHQVPVQSPEHRNLIGQQAAQVPFGMRLYIEVGGIAVLIIGRQLEAVQVRVGQEGLVAEQVFHIGYAHIVLVQEATGHHAVIEAAQ